MLRNILRNKEKHQTNPEVKKISILLRKLKIDLKVSELYKIGETLYERVAVFEKVKEEIVNQNLPYLLSLTEVDVTKDLIQIYLIVDENRNNILLGIIDPYELYDNPSMIEYVRDIDFEPNLVKEKRIQ